MPYLRPATQAVLPSIGLSLHNRNQAAPSSTSSFFRLSPSSSGSSSNLLDTAGTAVSPCCQAFSLPTAVAAAVGATALLAAAAWLAVLPAPRPRVAPAYSCNPHGQSLLQL